MAKKVEPFLYIEGKGWNKPLKVVNQVKKIQDKMLKDVGVIEGDTVMIYELNKIENWSEVAKWIK